MAPPKTRREFPRGARVALLVLCACLAAGTAVAAPKVDVVVLQNGTRVVGEIRTMSRGKLELKTDDMGTLEIEWGNVSEVTAPEYFEVEDDELAREPRRDRHHQHGERRDATRSGRASSATTPISRAGRSRWTRRSSEADTNQRNQAIGYLMYAYGYIKANPCRRPTSTPSSARWR
jgi:hypothetical protein